MRSGRSSTAADKGPTVAAKGFVINRHGRLVFPSNAWPRLDFSVFDTVGQLSAAVSRDFEAKAPSASLIVSRLEAGDYPSRYEFLRDLGLHAFWVNRFAITMYDKRPARWRDVPRDRDDVFLPAGAGRQRCWAAAPCAAVTHGAPRRGLPTCRDPEAVLHHAPAGIARGRDR